MANSAEPEFSKPISQGDDLRYSSLRMVLGSPNVASELATEFDTEELMIEMELVVSPDRPATIKRKSQDEIQIWIIDFSVSLSFISA